MAVTLQLCLKAWRMAAEGSFVSLVMYLLDLNLEKQIYSIGLSMVEAL